MFNEEIEYFIQDHVFQVSEQVSLPMLKSSNITAESLKEAINSALSAKMARIINTYPTFNRRVYRHSC